MALHTQATALLEMMASLGGPLIEESTPDEFRTYYLSRQVPPTENVHEIRDISAGGVPCRLYRPNANKMGHAVLSVDYRLAPEHPWPAAAEDALCSLRWAYDNADELGINPDRIAVGGDSAGGNLAAVVSQQRPVPLVFQMLIYPATDMTQSFASHQENAAGPVLTKGAMAWFIGHYMPKGSDLKDPLASPGFSPDNLLKGAPPALVITAEHDPLRDEGEAYGRRLIENGVPASIIRYNGMFHSFFGMAGLLDDADTAQVLAASMTAKALSA